MSIAALRQDPEIASLDPLWAAHLNDPAVHDLFRAYLEARKAKVPQPAVLLIGPTDTQFAQIAADFSARVAIAARPEVAAMHTDALVVGAAPLAGHTASAVRAAIMLGRPADIIVDLSGASASDRLATHAALSGHGLVDGLYLFATSARTRDDWRIAAAMSRIVRQARARSGGVAIGLAPAGIWIEHAGNETVGIDGCDGTDEHALSPPVWLQWRTDLLNAELAAAAHAQTSAPRPISAEDARDLPVFIDKLRLAGKSVSGDDRRCMVADRLQTCLDWLQGPGGGDILALADIYRAETAGAHSDLAAALDAMVAPLFGRAELMANGLAGIRDTASVASLRSLRPHLSWLVVADDVIVIARTGAAASTRLLAAHVPPGRMYERASATSIDPSLVAAFLEASSRARERARLAPPSPPLPPVQEWRTQPLEPPPVRLTLAFRVKRAGRLALSDPSRFARLALDRIKRRLVGSGNGAEAI